MMVTLQDGFALTYSSGLAASYAVRATMIPTWDVDV